MARGFSAFQIRVLRRLPSHIVDSRRAVFPLISTGRLEIGDHFDVQPADLTSEESDPICPESAKHDIAHRLA
jgi:hypothetical protein